MAASELGDGGACSAAMAGRCSASATVGSEGRARNGNVSWEGRRARAQAVDSGARPATACGLRGQAAGDAWRTRGHRVRNLSNTVASI